MTQHNWMSRPRAVYKPSGNSGGQQTVQSQTQVQLPQWVNNAAQDVWSLANQTSQNLMQPYSGQRVANMTPEALTNISTLQGNVGSTNPIFQSAQNTAQGVANYSLPANVQSFMDPYTQSVIDPTLAIFNQQRQQQLNQIGDQAIKTGAFAGSRQGVAEGTTNAQSNLLGSQFAGQLNSQNYAQALQAALANQQLNLQGANAMGNLAQQGQGTFLAGLGAAQAGQGQFQQWQQDQLNAALQQYNEQRQNQMTPLDIQSSVLRGLPYGQTSDTTQTGPGPSSSGFLTGLGGTAAGLGIIGSGLGLLNPATAAGGGFAALTGGFGGGATPAAQNAWSAGVARGQAGGFLS